MTHRTTPVGAALAASLRRQRARLERGIERGQTRPLELKRARVAIRRLREALALVEAGAPSLATRRLGRDLRDVRRALGAPRGADANLAEWTVFARRADWPGERMQPIARRLEREKRRASNRLARWLDDHDHEGIHRRLQRLIDALPAAGSDAGWRAAAGALLLGRLGALETACRECGILYAPQRLHDARVAIKKFRYLLELTAPLLGVDVRPVLIALRAAQRSYGRLNDREQLRQWAAGEAVHGSSRAVRLSAQMLADALELECRALHARTLPAFRGLAAALAALRRDLTQALVPRSRRRPVRMTVAAATPDVLPAAAGLTW